MTIRPKRSALALVAAAAVLAACEGGMMSPFASRSATETFTPIVTEEDFRAQVVGREVVYANGAIGTYGTDGTWTVTDGDAAIGGGTWEWTDDRWCRQGATVEGPVAPGCDAVAISATGVRFTREDGAEGTLPFRT